MTLLVLALMLVLQDVPPAPSAAAAAIRGRITEAETGAALSDAVVTLRIAGTGRELQTAISQDGRYEFTGLPAGSYMISASAGEHLLTHNAAGYSTSPRPEVFGTGITLKAGETRADIDITLHRSRAISGRVVDEDGEPLAGIPLRVFRAPGGQPVGMIGQRQTDDQGRFRVFNLRPGQYFLCAAPNHEITFQDHSTGARPRRPVATCHPSATGDALGRAIAVTGDVDGIEIRVARPPALTISGTVLDDTGVPAAGATVMLSQTWRGQGGGSGIPMTEGSTFTISNVPPGRYLLHATIGGDRAKPSPDARWAAVELTVGTADIESIVLTLARPARVNGRVLFEDGAPEEITAISVQAEPSLLAASRGPAITVGRDHRFEATGIFGPSVLRVSGLPGGWIVKSIRYRGTDVTNVPTEFRTGPDELEILLTRRVATLSGRVVDGLGNVVQAGRVVLAPADPAQWRAGSIRNSVRVSSNGRFTFRPMAAGEYLVVALSEGDHDALGDNPPYASIASLADRITLNEHERRTLDVRMAAVPPVR